MAARIESWGYPVVNAQPKADGSGFSTVKRVSPTQQVREQLTAAILSQEYKPGEMLPSERKMCEAFGVSRVCIREALASLEAMGMISIQHGRGAFVRASIGDQFAPFGVYVDLHREELIDLLKIRGALDGLAAEGASTRMDENELMEIQLRHKEFVDAVAQGASAENLVMLDINFHRSIAAAAGSFFLPGILKDLNEILEESRLVFFKRQGRPQVSVKQHQLIVDAVIAHDPKKAHRAAVDHVQGIVDWITTVTNTILFNGG